MSQILSPNGFAEGGAATPLALPHPLTFAAIFGGAQQTYFHGNFDEAVRHSREDALLMRRDGFLRGLLQERQLSTAGSRWHLEIDDERDRWQAAVRDHMTKVSKAVPHLQQQIFLPLLENIWYGRYGVQDAWEWKPSSHPQLGTFRALTPRAFAPVNGDKIGHRYSGVPYILVHAAEADHLKDADVITTTLSRGMLLKGSWRDRFIIARHRIEDADYFDAERGDAINGIGIRDVIFWNDWLKREYLAWLTDYIERAGLGLTLIKYEAGNKAAEDRAQKIAEELEGRKTVLLCPYLPGEKGPDDAVVRVETPMGAAELILKILKMFDHWIRYFVTGEGTGTDDTGRHSVGGDEAALMTSAKWKLNRLDAINLADTLTLDFLGVMKKWTFPWADFPVRWAFDIDAPDVGERLSAINKQWDMGVSFKADEVRSLTGMTKPQEGDEVISKEKQLQQEAALKPLPDPNRAQDGSYTSKGKPGEEAPGGQGPETMPAGGEGSPAPAEPARTMAAAREEAIRFVRNYKSRMPGRNPPFEARHPRVPIGNPDGGDWTEGNNPSAGGGTKGGTKSPTTPAPKAAPPAKVAAPAAPPAPPKSPRMAQLEAKAAEIERRLPPPPPGTTRLWRGNRPGEEGKATTYSNDLAGIGLPFREGYGGKLTYVDVPTADLGKYENKVGTASGAEFNLPKELAANAGVVEDPSFAYRPPAPKAAPEKTPGTPAGWGSLGEEVPAAPPAAPPAAKAPPFPPDDELRQGGGETTPLEKQLAAVVPAMGQAVKDAAAKYGASWFGQVNDALRNNQPLEGVPKQVYDGLKAGFADPRSALPEPATVRRGIRFRPERAAGYLKQLQAVAASGGTVKLPGFVSTSFDAEVAVNFARKDKAMGGELEPIIFEVVAKRGLYLDTEKGSSERELLLDEGQEYKVHAVRRVKYRDQNGKDHSIRTVQLEQP